MQKGNQPSKIKQGQTGACTENCQGDIKEKEGGQFCYSKPSTYTPIQCPWIAIKSICIIDAVYLKLNLNHKRIIKL